MNDLDNIIAQAASIEVKPAIKHTKPDVGGVRKREKDQEVIEATRTAIAPRRARVPSEAYINLENAVGGRQSLVDTLKFCPESSSAHRAIQKLLVDEALSDVNTAISALCFKNRVRFESLALAFKDALTAKLAVEALIRLSENSDEVFEQIAVHATDRFDQCPVCEGKRRVRRIGDNGEWAQNPEGEFLTQLCYNCRGSGKLFKEHDVQDRKLYLEILGVIDRKGININNNVQSAVVGGSLLPGDGSFERLIKAVDMSVGTRKKSDEEEVIDSELVSYETPSDPA